MFLLCLHWLLCSSSGFAEAVTATIAHFMQIRPYLHCCQHQMPFLSPQQLPQQPLVAPQLLSPPAQPWLWLHQRLEQLLLCLLAQGRSRLPLPLLPACMLSLVEALR